MAQSDDDDEIYWSESGAPRSRLYDDVFFSDVDGLAESQHVFVEGGGLPEGLSASPLLRLGEIGFGVGLNFCAALRAVENAPNARLDYAGFERSPPSAEEIKRALAPWPEVAEPRRALLEKWPPPEGERTPVTSRAALTLFIGEAIETIERLDAPRDIWWLDGFSPAKNPEAWSEELLRKIFERTTPGGRLATYAAAGWVRRGLAAAGFAVMRAPGFGTKREMLTARRPD